MGDTDAASIRAEAAELAAKNRSEEKELDELFTAKTKVEREIGSVEKELDHEKRMADIIVADMTPNMRLSYQKLKNTNESLGKTLESQQETLDDLDTRRKTLETELSSS